MTELEPPGRAALADAAPHLRRHNRPSSRAVKGERITRKTRPADDFRRLTTDATEQPEEQPPNPGPEPTSVSKSNDTCRPPRRV